MWDDSPPHLGQYASSSSQESLGAYNGKEKEHEPQYPEFEECTPPAPNPQFECARSSSKSQFSGNNAQYAARPRLPISQSSELAYALCGPQDASQGQGQGGDEMLELHHALAGYAEHPSVAELASSYSIGTFAAPGQDGGAPYNMY